MMFATRLQTHVQLFANAFLNYLAIMFSRALTILFATLLAFSTSAADSILKSPAKIVVLVFISSDCPVSNKFAPELERLAHKFPSNEVSFNLVYPNASDSDAKIAAHRRDYRLTGPFLRDTKHRLVKETGVTVTPEAVVFDQNRNIAYRGRVNDQYLALGKGRPAPTQHDLEDAITALVSGQQPKESRTEAIGCSIQD
jgi:thiol-disulfide isomerase/thioredoxin